MTIRADCIRRPLKPVLRSFVPDGGKRYKVQDGDSWTTLVQQLAVISKASLDPWSLIRFNYPGLPSDVHQASLEVNWYLQEYVGCKQLTLDRENYIFSSSATPGIIYLPEPSLYVVDAPILASIKDRRESIMANTPATFIVDDSPSATPYKEAFYSVKGFEEVNKNARLIEQFAYHEDLDPDFVKAIVWMETTHGYYDRVDPWNKTLRPMNVHDTLWSGLGVSRVALKNRAMNIAAGARILAAIWERTKDPNPEKVATLYNQLSATKVNDYGRTVAHYMEQRPWLHK